MKNITDEILAALEAIYFPGYIKCICIELDY